MHTNTTGRDTDRPQSTIEFRIVNTSATHVFSERFLTPEAAYDRIAEYAGRGEIVTYLSVFTISAPKHHHLEVLE